MQFSKMTAKEDLVARLRELLLEFDKADYRAGIEDGREWAADNASAEELARLKRFFRQFENLNPASPHFIADMIHTVITGKHDRAESCAFWYSVTDSAAGDSDDLRRSPYFLRGFIKGVLKDFSKTKPPVGCGDSTP